MQFSLIIFAIIKRIFRVFFLDSPPLVLHFFPPTLLKLHGILQFSFKSREKNAVQRT